MDIIEKGMQRIKAEPADLIRPIFRNRRSASTGGDCMPTPGKLLKMNERSFQVDNGAGFQYGS
jgi:hypothetical protein